MKKLNKFEAGVIADALDLWAIQFKKEIKEVESTSGGRCLYHESYPETIKRDLLLSIEQVTKKR